VDTFIIQDQRDCLHVVAYAIGLDVNRGVVSGECRSRAGQRRSPAARMRRILAALLIVDISLSCFSPLGTQRPPVARQGQGLALEPNPSGRRTATGLGRGSACELHPHQSIEQAWFDTAHALPYTQPSSQLPGLTWLRASDQIGGPFGLLPAPDRSLGLLPDAAWVCDLAGGPRGALRSSSDATGALRAARGYKIDVPEATCWRVSGHATGRSC